MTKSIEDYDRELKDICGKMFDEKADLRVSLKKVMSKNVFIELLSELVLRHALPTPPARSKIKK